MGVFTNYSGSSDFYIADNYFIGRDDPKHLIGWIGTFWAQFDGVDGQKFPPMLASYTAVRLYGPGHVVAYNYVANFHDGIDIETYGNPDGSHAIDGPHYPPREYWDRRPVAIDYYNNYMTNFHDNAFEIDGSMHNVRVMRNMMVNSASHPFCNQPAIGGPIYWIRNIAYHAPGGSTRMTNGAAGRALLQQYDPDRDLRGILGERALAQQPDAGREFRSGDLQRQHQHELQLLGLQRFSSESRSGVLIPVEFAAVRYSGRLQRPAARRAGAAAPADPAPIRRWRRAGSRRSPNTAEATHQDQHSVVVDYDIFVNVPKLDAQDLKKVQKLYKAEDFDFRLKPGSAAIDRGVVLPNVTDGFTGQAPDLGALEVGQTPPHYGPRP